MNTEGFFRFAFWALIALTLAMRSWYAVRARHAGERLWPDRASILREGWGLFFLRLVIFLLLVGVVVLAFVHPIDSHLSLALGWRWAGLALSTAGLALWVWTHQTLGRFWSAKLRVRDDHRLIVSGPYAYVRHPMYSAILGWAVGLGLLVASWLPLVLAALAGVLFVGRAPREEKMMIEEFGDNYRTYMKTTGRFLPRWQALH